MGTVALRPIDPDRNMARFYEIGATPTLFGEWAVIRRWERIGSSGHELEVWFPDEPPALSSADRLLTAKRRRGYQDVEC